VYFDASGTIDPDSDEEDLTYKWYFGDGGESTSIDNTTIYRYTTPGSYQVTLEVVDETGMNSSLSNIIITVKNRYPSAIIKVDTSVIAGDTVKLSAADSSDDDGMIVSYIWSFGDGSNDVSTNDTQVNHSWNKPGTYTIELTVQDDRGGTSESSVVITVKDEDSGDSGPLGMSTEEFNTVMLFVVITIIIVVVLIIVVVVILKTRESI
jgi:PKD repeat protein